MLPVVIFWPLMTSGILLAEARAHVAQRGAHLLLRLLVHEVDERRVLVAVARRCLARMAVAR